MSSDDTETTANVPSPALWQIWVSELIGTFILVAAIVFAASTMTAVTKLAHFAPPFATMITVVVVALAAYWALSILAGGYGWKLPAEFNPAVTLAVALSKPFEKTVLWMVPVKWLCQLVGAFAAVYALHKVIENDPLQIGGLAVPTRETGLVSLWLFILEAVGTAILVLTVLGSVNKQNDAGDFGSNIGRALGVGILITGYWTGGGLNPARSLAPMLLSGHFTDWQYYTFAPLVGGLAAAGIYKALTLVKP